MLPNVREHVQGDVPGMPEITTLEVIEDIPVLEPGRATAPGGTPSSLRAPPPRKPWSAAPCPRRHLGNHPADGNANAGSKTSCRNSSD